MYFQDRRDAGRKLAVLLKDYRDKDVVVFALPRGGVAVGVEVAKALDAPLDLIITRKLGHPLNPELAIGAVAEDGHLLLEGVWKEQIDHVWLGDQIAEQIAEARRRREKYVDGRTVPVEGRTAILVDDGIATGLTIRLGIRELRLRKPARVVVAVPVSPEETAETVRREADEFVALEVPEFFAGAIGFYYFDFEPVEDEEVIRLMEESKRDYDEKTAKRQKVSRTRTERPIELRIGGELAEREREVAA